MNNNNDNETKESQLCLETTMGTSQRNSYMIDDSPNDIPPLPLNYIVKLEETFVDNEFVNFMFEYLPG
jgi:hypothetical protein